MDESHHVHLSQPVTATRPTKGLARFTSCFNGRLLYSTALIAVSQLNFGMDQGAFTGTQAMAYFTRKFGVFNAQTGTWHIEPYFLSFLNSFTYIGFAFGLVTGSFISNRFGRKICLFSMCLWAIVGAAVMITAQHKTQILVGRIIGYVYIGMELAVVPVTQSELVPAQVRGFVVGTYQSGLLLGQLVSALVCRGTSTVESDASWRIPIGLLFIVPCLVASGVWYMPESPRWLLMKKREGDALDSLRKLRRGRFSEDEIHQELRELQSTIDLTVETGRFAELFHSTNLKRTLIVVGVNVFLQLTGQNFASVYGTIFIKSLHTVNAFTMTSVNIAVNIVMTLLTQFLSDTTGRVPLMLTGAIIQTGCLFTMGALGTVSDPSYAIKSGITAMVTVFGIGFQLGWAPLSHVVTAEIPTTRLRDQVCFILFYFLTLYGLRC